MNSEVDFIHDLVSQISIAYGKVDRVLMKKDKFTHQEIIQNVEKAKDDLDKVFKLINERKLTLSNRPNLK
jgi:hypothetical protein